MLYAILILPAFFIQVSKPLMEKKRRARINKCLDQLKSLLESYYSTSVSIQAVTLESGMHLNLFTSDQLLQLKLK